MRDSVNPRITRRSVLALAGAAALPVPYATAAEPSVIRVAYPAAVATLDPAKFRVGGLEYNYALCVFNRLTKQDTKLQVLPDLAASWEASEDLKTWIFHRFWCKSAAPICAHLMRRITFRLEALRSRPRAQFRAEGRNVVARTAPCGYGASARCRRS